MAKGAQCELRSAGTGIHEWTNEKARGMFLQGKCSMRSHTAGSVAVLPDVAREFLLIYFNASLSGPAVPATAHLLKKLTEAGWQPQAHGVGAVGGAAQPQQEGGAATSSGAS